MEETNHAIARWLTEAGWSETYVNLAVKAVIILGILVVAYAAAVLFRRLVVPLLQKISARTKAVWDDHLFSDKVMHRAARLIPPLIWYVLLRVAFYDTPVLLNVLHKACLIYLIVAVLQLVAAFLDTLYEISSRHETLRNRPLKGVYQMIKLLAVCVGAILIVSILIGQDATAVLAGLGASAAIIMLIFRDSILGLVAGVQLSANDMLRPGDWITMAKYGADGYVTEVTLTTVKVQNFDKTITTIPPYALVSDSFQNWRGMWDSGGRRIKRSLLIDASSVHNCTAAELAALREKGLAGTTPDAEPVVNLYALREYAARYLKGHPGIHPDLMQMVRMLQPTPEGIPVEVYCFPGRPTGWPTRPCRGLFSTTCSPSFPTSACGPTNAPPTAILNPPNLDLTDKNHGIFSAIQPHRNRHRHRHLSDHRHLSPDGHQGRILFRGENLVAVPRDGNCRRRRFDRRAAHPLVDAAGRVGRLVAVVDRRTVRTARARGQRLVSEEPQAEIACAHAGYAC